MKILCCPSDRQGCGRYRLGLPVAALQQQELNLEIRLADGVPVKLDSRTGEAKGFADGVGGGGWDVLVVQRPMSRSQIIGLRDARRQGIRTIVEVDDDFSALHPLSPAHVQTHPRLSDEWNRTWLGVACREADLVTVTTPALARRYAPHGRVVVLPNYIPEAWLSITAKREGNVVGWTGAVATHPGDLGVTNGGVALAVKERSARFRVIGQQELVRRDLRLHDEPEWQQWSTFDEYPTHVAKLDVGIAPLRDTAFNRSKSWLKPLEMAALGVPVVMSPLPEYTAMYDAGIGVLAKDRARDWRREVSRLLADAAYRHELGSIAREAAADLTIERNSWRFAEAWTASTPVAR